MSSPGKKQFKKLTKSNHTRFQRTIPAKRYLGNLVSGLRFKPSTSWQKSQHTTLDIQLGISKMLLVQFTTTITLNRKLYSHIKENNMKLSLCLIKHHIITQYYAVNWSLCPHGLRRKSVATHLLRLWVQIPPETRMIVASVVCCQVEVSAMSWSLIQRSPTSCGACMCSTNIENLEAMACIWPQCHRKKNPWSRPWEGRSVQLANKFPSFYSTWRLITMFTEAYCWSLFLARLLPSMPSYPVSSRNTLIPYSNLRIYLQGDLHPLGISTIPLNALHFLPTHVTVLITLIFRRDYESQGSSAFHFLQPPATPPSYIQILSSAP